AATGGHPQQADCCRQGDRSGVIVGALYNSKLVYKLPSHCPSQYGAVTNDAALFIVHPQLVARKQDRLNRKATAMFDTVKTTLGCLLLAASALAAAAPGSRALTLYGEPPTHAETFAHFD